MEENVNVEFVEKIEQVVEQDFFALTEEKRKKKLSAAEKAVIDAQKVLASAPKSTKIIQELLSTKDFIQELVDDNEVLSHALDNERKNKAELLLELKNARAAMEGKQAAYYIVRSETPPPVAQKIEEPKREFTSAEILAAFGVDY